MIKKERKSSKAVRFFEFLFFFFLVRIMDPNLREKDAIEEELELLSSVFSLKGESCVLQARTPRTLIEVTQSVTASSSEAVATTFKISFEIEAEQYPEWQAPKISLTCLDKGLTRAQGLNITEVLNKEAEAYLGMSQYFLSLS